MIKNIGAEPVFFTLKVVIEAHIREMRKVNRERQEKVKGEKTKGKNKE